MTDIAHPLSSDKQILKIARGLMVGHFLSQPDDTDHDCLMYCRLTIDKFIDFENEVRRLHSMYGDLIQYMERAALYEDDEIRTVIMDTRLQYQSAKRDVQKRLTTIQNSLNIDGQPPVSVSWI